MTISTQASPGELGFEFGAMASACEVRIAGLPQKQASLAAQAAIDEVHRIERKYSRYRDDGIVATINAGAGGSAVECDTETIDLLRYAATLFEASDGRFDPTSGVLRRAWDFGRKIVPSGEALAALLPLIDWPAVELGATSVRLPRVGMELDFGGFGKEYAVDRACAALLAQGVRHGWVNLGGDLRAVGPQPDGAPWSMGIQDPRDASRTIASLPLSVGAIATSGDYERYFELDAKRYCHVFDPRTGMPVSYWRSLSVLAPVAVAAGSCSTIGMLLERDAPQWLDDAGVPWLGIDHTGKLIRGALDPDVMA